mgnify:CR=1 FL=1
MEKCADNNVGQECKNNIDAIEGETNHRCVGPFHGGSVEETKTKMCEITGLYLKHYGNLLDEKSNLAESLLKSIAFSFGNRKGGLTLGVVLVGAILGATTGVVGATVVTLAVIALPILIENNYDKAISAGTIATAGTLGQIVPPSIVLLLLAYIYE